MYKKLLLALGIGWLYTERQLRLFRLLEIDMRLLKRITRTLRWWRAGYSFPYAWWRSGVGNHCIDDEHFGI